MPSSQFPDTVGKFLVLDFVDAASFTLRKHSQSTEKSIAFPCSGLETIELVCPLFIADRFKHLVGLSMIDWQDVI